MLLASLLWLTVGGHSLQDGWYKARVDVPDVATLNRLNDSNLNVMDCVPHLGTADVAIGPGEEAELEAGGYTYRIVSKLEDPRNWGDRHTFQGITDEDDYRLHYFNADQILAFFENLRLSNPSVVTRQSIGASRNGETIWAYRFKPPPLSRVQPPRTVVIEGLIHAREWITGACVMHVAQRVLTTINSVRGATRSAINPDVWIIPIINPDGYRYTWTTNRLWRKNRRNNGNGTFGVDLNRNFSKGWGGAGSSGNTSSETYRGPSAFSEPETQAVQGLLQSLQGTDGFIDYHSYGQLILWPWSYTTSAPPDAAALNALGAQIKSQMDLFGATYVQGQAGPTLYLAGGTSKDYVYDSLDIPAFTIELRDTGNDGFLLPESEISATQDEVWAGFTKFLNLVGP